MPLLSTLKYHLRSITSVILLGACAIYGVVISCVFNVIGQKRLSQWSTARCFNLIMGGILGISFKVINEHYLNESAPCIFISNHQSTLDILMLGRTFPKGCTVTSKKSLKYVPFLGWFMSLSGTLFLDRANRDKSVNTLNKGLQRLVKEKGSLWIFPEGTRSRTTELKMLPFKKGAFWLAKEGKIPVVPVIVSNTSTINNAKLKIFNRGEITVKILAPESLENIETKEQMNEFVARIENEMNDELKNNVGYSTPIDSTGVPQEYLDWLAKKQACDSTTDVETESVDVIDANVSANDEAVTSDNESTAVSADVEVHNITVSSSRKK
ncbi:hypothetical protein ACO0RG_002008 [Hanseniaspora osmophila]|uniref:1-acyl-sn-glycerol-3-phosphate acyltransferase n=1 Tax=Hanseniaspora osmophila TaxID=56408 RepID=A0A1E5RI38_9ASCO|nr:putative 1-acyl-sn-glycerol-3-phosphate acyltransferase [Hanseniaspora osmophila]